MTFMADIFVLPAELNGKKAKNYFKKGKKLLKSPKIGLFYQSFMFF